MTIFDIVVISSLILCLILLLEIKRRNLLIFELKIEWCNKVCEYRYFILDNYGVKIYNQMDEIFSQEQMHDIMYNYVLLLFMFWKGDLRSCIKPMYIPLFEEIISIKKENL